jgi:chemotaxis signal transduction protein
MRESNLTYEDDLEEDEDLLEDMYLTFAVYNQDFGLDIKSVVEIVVLQYIKEVREQCMINGSI